MFDKNLKLLKQDNLCVLSKQSFYLKFLGGQVLSGSNGDLPHSDQVVSVASKQSLLKGEGGQSVRKCPSYSSNAEICISQ